MKVEEYKIGNSVISIHDDYIVPPEKRQEILNNVGRIVSYALKKQNIEKKTETA